ncbi:signal peptidase II, partial [Candidatus Woesearchaeota archaeon]|nr:signal peptidase II [Candidatus Woesearchaeota archaeon]
WGVLAGAGVISNLVDRVARGGVVDYLDLGWWPVFNLADALIVAGILLLAWTLVREDREQEREARNEKRRGVRKK